ncbi:UNVERIFIED_CONTAM: hypothetical protein NCL1_38766 [Trichonephila clavipes]
MQRMGWNQYQVINRNSMDVPGLLNTQLRKRMINLKALIAI